jgi:hypothetical protein
MPGGGSFRSSSEALARFFTLEIERISPCCKEGVLNEISAYCIVHIGEESFSGVVLRLGYTQVERIKMSAKATGK